LKSLFSVFISLCLVLACDAEVLDRIVAVVEGRIITLSDLRQEREIRAQLGEKPIDDDKALARELVDSYLIERQIADYPNIDVTDAEVEAELKKINARAASVSDLRDAVRRRIRIQNFFDIKFRQLIRPADDEIRKYYEEVFVPEARARGLQSILPLSDPEMTRAIRENVIQEKLNHEIEVWLEAIRRRSNVEVFD
jgi:parvulin-like peptidyl-prolyl isomerase